MDNRVVISGLGFVTKRGFTEEAVWDALCNPERLYQEESCTLELPLNMEERFRDICYCANIGINAAFLALKNHTLTKDGRHDDWGIYCGTKFGSFTVTQKIQCDSYIKMGPAGITPAQLIHSGYHITADIVAIDYGIAGPNITFTSGSLASGMALMQAFDDIRHRELHGVVCIGSDAVDEMIKTGHKIAGYERLQELSSGACSIIIQSDKEAQAHEMKIRGVIKSVETSGYPGVPGKYSFHICKTMQKVIQRALKNAELNPEDIDLIVSTMGDSGIERKCFKRIYKGVFGGEPDNTRILMTRKTFGDTMGANAILGTGAGILCMDRQMVPIEGQVIKKTIKNILITAEDPSGSAWALILAKE